MTLPRGQDAAEQSTLKIAPQAFSLNSCHRGKLTQRRGPRLSDGVPIWAGLYLLVIAGFAVWSVVDDMRQGDSRLRVLADVVAMSILGFLFVSYFVPGLADALGRVAAPLFLVAFLWTGIAAQREIAEENDDPDLSPRANFVAEHIGIAIGVVAFSPLIAFAGMAALQLWQTSG